MVEYCEVRCDFIRISFLAYTVVANLKILAIKGLYANFEV